MQPMIELHPAADALDGLGLPAIPYPVALPAFQAAVGDDAPLPLADMLHGLQVRAATASHVERLEPAMARLAELLAARGARQAAAPPAFERWLVHGAVDLSNTAVVIERGGSLLAALAPHGDGRLRIAAYRALDARAAGMVIGFARDDGWQRARDAAADANVQAARTDPVVPHLLRESRGGCGADAHAPHPRPAAHVRAELATCHALGARAPR